MIKGSISEIETMGLVDGPGIRFVVFLNGCRLRCKYCHNPETWQKKEGNTTPTELVKKILRYKPYFKDTGGVTFSGGEPLLQKDFIIETAKLLKKENINIALDTAGIGTGNYEEILKYIDIVLLDIKNTTKKGFKELTTGNIEDQTKFIEALNKSNTKVWIRQVIIPNITDTDKYLASLHEYIKKINNIENITFLPYHSMAKEKYKKLNIDYPFKDVEDMDKEKCKKLEQQFIKEHKK